jgi:hypothetical protein
LFLRSGWRGLQSTALYRSQKLFRLTCKSAKCVDERVASVFVRPPPRCGFTGEAMSEPAEASEQRDSQQARVRTTPYGPRARLCQVGSEGQA